MILQDIKETKRYRHTVGESDNVNTVYHPTNTVCGGIKIHLKNAKSTHILFIFWTDKEYSKIPLNFIIGHYLSKRYHKTVKHYLINCNQEALTNTGTPLLKSHKNLYRV